MASPIASVKGRCKVGGVSIELQDFQLTDTAEFADTTSSEDFDAARGNRTFGRRVKGTHRAKFTASGYYDTDATPTGLALRGGATGSSLYWYPDKDTVANFYYLPSFTVDEVQVGMKIPGTNYITFSFKGESQAGYDVPVG